MNVTEDDIMALVAFARNGESKAKSRPKAKTEADYLKEIASSLQKLLSKPEPKIEKADPPKITVEAPQVTVKPPEVTVNVPDAPKPEPRIKKWTFEMERDFSGKLKTITATAG